jgi:hypothetical protein
MGTVKAHCNVEGARNFTDPQVSEHARWEGLSAQSSTHAQESGSNEEEEGGAGPICMRWRSFIGFSGIALMLQGFFGAKALALALQTTK